MEPKVILRPGERSRLKEIDDALRALSAERRTIMSRGRSRLKYQQRKERRNGVRIGQ